MVNKTEFSVPCVYLKPKRDKMVKARHPWIFSGAIARADADITSGQTVAVINSNGDFLGYGAWSPESQIRVRLWTSEQIEINADFFRKRLRKALQRRKSLRIPEQNTAWRLVAAESDGLPGVTVDYYNEYLVIQCLSAGAEFWKSLLISELCDLISPKGIIERSDTAARKKEGLPKSSGLLSGKIPDGLIEIQEHGRKYLVDVFDGHKTGFYLDQRDNRSLLTDYVQQKSVLNCFSYTGGFAVAAQQGGAKEIINVDVSEQSLKISDKVTSMSSFNSDANIEHLQGDVFQVLREFRDRGRKFDVIVLDPPKFAENKSQLKKAARGYKDINMLAFKLLSPRGVLFTFSCSGLMDSLLFQKIVADAALDAGVEASILRKMDQAQDHPTALPFPEGYYLKGLICQI